MFKLRGGLAKDFNFLECGWPVEAVLAVAEADVVEDAKLVRQVAQQAAKEYLTDFEVFQGCVSTNQKFVEVLVTVTNLDDNSQRGYKYKVDLSYFSRTKIKSKGEKVF